MSAANWLQLAALVGLVLISTPLLGGYLARVYGGESAPGDRIFLPVERAFYRLFGVDSSREQAWPVYAFSLLAFSAVSVIGLYASSGSRATCRSIPPMPWPCRRRSRSTPRSASSPTRTGRTTAASRP